MKKLFGLGKGLNSLIPPANGATTSPSKKENVFYVEVTKIEANPDQPRQDFDSDGLKELSQSIRKYGILQPLLVSKVEKESPRGLEVSYQLIAGERRLRAARLAGLPQVPVVIRDDFPKERDRLEVALIENVQREDLNPLEEAEAYDRLSKEFGLTQKEIAEKVSKSREVVANTIRLLGLPTDMRDSLKAGKIGRAQARALLAFKDPKDQREVYQKILSGAMTSREVEDTASRAKSSSGAKRNDGRFKELEKNLGTTIGAPVFIQAGASGGKIIVRFATLEDLNKIAKAIID